MRSHSRQRGFTLIEVAVAFAIFALSIGALYEISRDALRRSARAEEHARAWMTAESELAALRARAGPWPEEFHGITEDGMAWRVETAQHAAPARTGSPWRAFDVAVAVRPTESLHPELVLHSIELAQVR